MRRRLGGALPGGGAGVDARLRGEALLDQEMLQRLAPALVIIRAIAAAAIRQRLADLATERLRPFIGAEDAAILQGDDEGEGLRLPGLSEDRPLGIARDRCAGPRRA